MRDPKGQKLPVASKKKSDREKKKTQARTSRKKALLVRNL